MADPTLDPKAGAAEPMAAVRPRTRRGSGMLRDPQFVVGASLVVLIVVVAVIGPLLTPFDPLEIHQDDPYLPPLSGGYILGTDDLGRDLLSRVMTGLRISLTVAVASVLVSFVLGSVIGVASGYFKGAVDAVLMRVVDVLFAFPIMLLALLMIAILGSGTWTVVLAVALVYIPYFARIARSSTLSQSVEPYVMMLRASGVGDTRIMLRHILPNIAAPLIVQTTFCLTWAVLVEASLSFLGLGVQPPDPSIGSLISEGQNVMRQSPWLVIVPTVTLCLFILGLNLMGDGLRDGLDPRRKGKR